MSHLFVVVPNKWPVLSTYKRISKTFIRQLRGASGGWRLKIIRKIPDRPCLAAGKLAAIGLWMSTCFEMTP
jgi:hypothetical protein